MDLNKKNVNGILLEATILYVIGIRADKKTIKRTSKNSTICHQ